MITLSSVIKTHAHSTTDTATKFQLKGIY